MEKSQAELIHTVVAQSLFLCEQAQQDILPVIAYLTTRVRSPNQDDWNKLEEMMKFLRQMTSDVLMIRLDESTLIEWQKKSDKRNNP